MNSFYWHGIRISIALASAFVLQCSSPSSPVADGGGTETTNGITVAGVAVTADGEIIPRAPVHVRDLSFLPSTESTTPCSSARCPNAVTDDSGYFSLFVAFDRRVMVSISDGGSLVFAQTIPLAVESVWTGPFVLRQANTVQAGLRVLDGTDISSGFVRAYGLQGVSPIVVTNTAGYSHIPDGIFTFNLIGYTSTDTINTDFTLDIQGSAAKTISVFDTRDGLRAAWSLDETTGPEVADNSGNGFSGTRSGALPAEGKIAGAFEFYDNAHKVTIDTPVDPPGRGTMTFWIKPSDTSRANARIISSSASMFEVSLRNGKISNELFAFENDYLLDTTVLAENRWYHIGCTWDSGTGLSQIYIDGNKTSEGAHADDDPGSIVVTFGQSDLHGSPYRGLLDDIKLYGRVLSSDEILALAGGVF
ncbi:MAG: hypothetical protein GF350_04880 [Chitinivibrionales bacterium]|nr:hypothetical protein [Chitinivibrionales bacterium]